MPQDATPENSDNAVLVKQLAAVEDKLSVAIETLRQAKVELDRKDQIIEALKKRLFGSKSERYNPDQLQLDFGDEILGKPEPEKTTDSTDTDDTEDSKKRSSSKRSKKRDLLPENLRVEIVDTIIPDDVKANPENYIEIDEEYHDELEVVKPELHFI